MALTTRGLAQRGQSGRRTMTVPVIAVAAVGAVASFSLSRVIWPDPPGIAPPDDLIPLFAIIGLFESLGFGLGLAFAVFGIQRVRRAGGRSWLTVATYLSITWLLLSWWPHDNLHRVLAHTDYVGLLRIEYGFHVTLIAASAVVALFFLRILSRRAADDAETGNA